MNKSVQILILLALIPLAVVAREETLEERKQRITRKYLRDHAKITQSAMMVPSEVLEDERIADSEKFKTAEVNLEREEAAASPIVPMPPPTRPVQTAEENWLLQGTEDITEFDEYGNPVAAEGADSDFWSLWGTEQETPPAKEQRASRGFNSPYGSDASSASGGRDAQQDSRIRTFGGASPASGTTQDIFGRTQSAPAYSSGFGLQRSTRTYGSDPEEGLLTSPFSRQEYSSRDQSETERSGTYQPYKSPYQQQREERSNRSSWSTPSSESQQYQRSDSYQQWKSQRKEYDPTADDAYINQMLQQNKR